MIQINLVYSKIILDDDALPILWPQFSFNITMSFWALSQAQSYLLSPIHNLITSRMLSWLNGSTYFKPGSRKSQTDFHAVDSHAYLWCGVEHFLKIVWDRVRDFPDESRA